MENSRVSKLFMDCRLKSIMDTSIVPYLWEYIKARDSFTGQTDIPKKVLPLADGGDHHSPETTTIFVELGHKYILLEWEALSKQI